MYILLPVADLLKATGPYRIYIIKYEKLKLFLLMHACNLITLMATRILKLMAKLNYSKLDIKLQEITRGTARL